MMADIFGDLRDWGKVLSQIESLSSSDEMEQHQDGLVRILRYRFNWQLRVAGLRAVKRLQAPTPELFAVLLKIIGDENCELRIRRMACEAVASGICARRAFGWSDEIGHLVTEFIVRFLSVRQFPILEEAVKSWSSVLLEPERQMATAADQR